MDRLDRALSPSAVEARLSAIEQQLEQADEQARAERETGGWSRREQSLEQ